MKSKKVGIEDVEMILDQNQIDPVKKNNVLKDLSNLVAQEKEEKDSKGEKNKKQYVVLLSDPEGLIDNSSMTAWVVQIPEEASMVGIDKTISLAARDYNESRVAKKKGKVSTIGEAIESIPNRFLIDKEIWIKTKTPVFVDKTNNVLAKVAE
jgi:hypothetical protein